MVCSPWSYNCISACYWSLFLFVFRDGLFFLILQLYFSMLLKSVFVCVQGWSVLPDPTIVFQHVIEVCFCLCSGMVCSPWSYNCISACYWSLFLFVFRDGLFSLILQLYFSMLLKSVFVCVQGWSVLPDPTIVFQHVIEVCFCLCSGMVCSSWSYNCISACYWSLFLFVFRDGLFSLILQLYFSMLLKSVFVCIQGWSVLPAQADWPTTELLHIGGGRVVVSAGRSRGQHHPPRCHAHAGWSSLHLDLTSHGYHSCSVGSLCSESPPSHSWPDLTSIGLT